MPTFIVKQLNGTVTDVTWDEDYTIERLKSDLSSRLDLPAEDMRLIYTGKALSVGSKTLLEYGVPPDATVHLVLRLRGGPAAEGSGAASPLPAKEITSKGASCPRGDREREANEGEESETYANVIRERRGAKM